MGWRRTATAERAAQRRKQRAAQAAVARAVALGARYAVEAAEQSVSQALARRAEAEAVSTGGAAELKAVRTRVRELAADLDTVVNTPLKPNAAARLTLGWTSSAVSRPRPH